MRWRGEVKVSHWCLNTSCFGQAKLNRMGRSSPCYKGKENHDIKLLLPAVSTSTDRKGYKSESRKNVIVVSLRCKYCFPFSTSCSQVSSNCNSLFYLGSCWWDWDGDPVVWAEQFTTIIHHSPGLEPRAATPVSSPGKSATWKTAVLCDNNNGIAWRDNVTNATVLEQTGSVTMHFIQCQHCWNLQSLTTTCSDEAHNITPWPSLKPSVLCTLSLYLYHRPKLPNEIHQPILSQDPIYLAIFTMSASSLIIITLGTVVLLSFVLCAKTKEKELLQKQLSQPCTCNDRSRIKHWTTVGEYQWGNTISSKN